MNFHVEEIFYSVQGEGYHSGMYCTFIRLRGCNARAKLLGCAEWCDTHYSWDPVEYIRDATSLTKDDLVKHLETHYSPVVVFTGGEPLLQLDSIAELLEHKISYPIEYHFETNGTIRRPNMPNTWYTVSPKPPHYDIEPGPINEIKVIMPRHETEINNLLCHFPKFQVLSRNLFIQPIDNDFEVAKKIVDDILPQYPGWRLNLQLHKLLEVR